MEGTIAADIAPPYQVYLVLADRDNARLTMTRPCDLTGNRPLSGVVTRGMGVEDAERRVAFNQ